MAVPGANHVTDHVCARLGLHGRALGAAHAFGAEQSQIVSVPGLVIPGRLMTARGHGHAGQINA